MAGNSLIRKIRAGMTHSSSPLTYPLCSINMRLILEPPQVTSLSAKQFQSSLEFVEYIRTWLTDRTPVS
ncbi:hypothetical protein N7495_002311 [Penicillium taxi]|uniref:uncharacterized protein n=1 Tax=Penicillium taxi TaxID=168475 RepID=UPI002544E33C|nr:uncharacterized protein N7495_002311 [Penicillium taxi]KAJ5901783.1 hypothetical protein N7495_002311 [Penicillium taxi]